MNSGEEVPVFAETTLGTRIAVGAPRNITAGDLKRKFETAHSNCFPELGKIAVDGIMVKLRSFFYYLPDSVPVKHACHGCGEPWFLYVRASPQNGYQRSSFVPEPLAAEARCCSPDVPSDKKPHRRDRRKKRKRQKRGIWRVKAVFHGIVAASVLSKKKRGRTMKKVKVECWPKRRELACSGIDGQCPLVPGSVGKDQKQVLHPMVERDSSPADTSSESSEAMSVSGIIKRYFSNLNHLCSPSAADTASKGVQHQLGEPLHSEIANVSSSAPNHKMKTLVVKTPQRTVVHKTPQRTLISSSPIAMDSPTLRKRTPQKCSVGRRFDMASNSLRACQNRQTPVSSLCRSKDKKLDGLDATSLVRSLVFEIGDND